MNHDLDLKAQVKQILKVAQELAPGRSVELRIPPFAAIQCVGGNTHRHGTPPNVVEMSAETLLKLSENPVMWQQYCDLGSISASGTNSNLANLFVEVSKLMNSEGRSENGK
jgi:hypothetical protein